MRGRLVPGLAALLWACATPAPAPQELAPARLSVEVARGSAPATPTPPRIALLLDATASMASPAARGVTKLEAARVRAAEILAAAPAEARLSVDALGPGDGDACRSPVSLATGPGGAASDTVRDLTAGGEASLADALAGVGRSLEASGGAAGARVVVLTDLEERCGGDLCASVKALVDGGASLDFVVLGDRPTPSCVASAEPGAGAGGAGSPGAISPAPTFRVLPAAGQPADGVAGGSPVSVAAGAARVEVALDPPLQVGPLPLAPGSLVRLRVLDFPRASPPQREWVIDVVEAGRAAGAETSSRP